MKLWIEFFDGDPVLFHTKTPDINTDVRRIDDDTLDDIPESLYLVVEKCEKYEKYHLFQNLIPALDFIFRKENRPSSVWHCWVDQFRDPDEISIDHLTTVPIKYISCLEISYRMYNPRMTAIDAFQEAISMWKIFGPENINILKQLIEHDPDFYSKMYEHHLRQHDLLMRPPTQQWTSLSQFLDVAYPLPRSTS